MKFNDLAVFTTVAKRLSFSAAAEELGITSSLVSRRVRLLEDKLGYRLFVRTTRRVQITVEGQHLLSLCEAPIEALTEALGSSVTGKGKIRVTASLFIAKSWLWPRLSAFILENPDISVELLPSNDYLDFSRDRIDLALRLGPLPSSNLVARRLFSVNYELYASQCFIEKHNIGSVITIGEFQKLPVVTSGVDWMFEEHRHYTPSLIAHHFADMELCGLAIASGFGVGYLPEGLMKSKLKPIRVSGLTPIQRELYAVFPSKRLLPHRIRLLLDWLTLAPMDESMPEVDDLPLDDIDL